MSKLVDSRSRNRFRTRLESGGRFVLPLGLRARHDLRTGAEFDIIDLGEGAFLLGAPSVVMANATEIERNRIDAGVSVADAEEGLIEERRRYVAEMYGTDYFDRFADPRPEK